MISTNEFLENDLKKKAWIKIHRGIVKVSTEKYVNDD